MKWEILCIISCLTAYYITLLYNLRDLGEMMTNLFIYFVFVCLFVLYLVFIWRTQSNTYPSDSALQNSMQMVRVSEDLNLALPITVQYSNDYTPWGYVCRHKEMHNITIKSFYSGPIWSHSVCLVACGLPTQLRKQGFKLFLAIKTHKVF